MSINKYGFGRLGKRWNYISYGTTIIGSKWFGGGSTGVSLTTYPWYFYKFNN
ncbi:MAG: hypothetical protein JXR51_15355 [Bacteroidales bacterium]|nr:hypothetical protein [Bacteroidales bacterium]MBN2758548.1 hypothetical protein [Bacteroidales bacterium]